MAETIVSTIASVITESLGSLTTEEVGRFLIVGNELKQLKRTVSTIQNVLADAEKRQHVSDAIKGWLGELEDILYDADDLLDDVSTEALRRKIMKDTMAKKVRKLFSKSNQFAHRFKIARKIKAIRERLDDAQANRTFHLEEGCVEASVVRDRARDNTHSFVCVENVFGRDNDRKAVIGRLMDANIKENVSVLPIVGLGGLGKTTLAQYIFRAKEVEETFELKIWVCVSDVFVVKDIVKKILESITNKRPDLDEMEPLVSKLQQSIVGKKYLLVLDDVWEKERNLWSKLVEPLMVGAKGSRILVTTRDKKVAEITRTMEPYSLRGLDDHSSWLLFKEVAFKNMQHVEYSIIVEMGRKIFEKCKGVPLAVKTIGNVLYFKNPETEWLLFINNELSEIPQDENDILPTLELSYKYLPSHLKQCFTYCSLFPKDYIMNKSLLINLWIAQGFVKPTKKNQDLEDIGHDYFMDLLWGSFFQEVMIDECGDIISCKMHDLMHDLATKVVGSLVTIVDGENVDISGKIRHISIKKASSAYEPSGVRTLLSPWQWQFGVDEEIFTKFKCLRSLDLNSSYLKSIPNSIGGLKHLRYLDLSCNLHIKKLPNAITRLQNLRTLNLLYCRFLRELPRDLKLLVNLRHLYLDRTSCLSYMPLGVGQLTNLQKLSRFVLNSRGGVLNSELTSRGCGLWGKSSTEDSPSAGLNELKELNGLRGKLDIGNLRHGKDFVSEYEDANLKEKSRLHTLELGWGWNDDDNDITTDEMLLEVLQPHPNLKRIFIYNYWGSRLPGWFCSLTSLVDLVLHCPNIQYLSPLCRLPCLKVLTVRMLKVKVIEYIPDSGDNYERLSSSSSPVPFFPSLEELVLDNNSSLEGFWGRRNSCREVNNDGNNSVENASGTKQFLLPSFPCLSKLSILKCPSLSFMPMFPHHEELSLWGSNFDLELANDEDWVQGPCFKSLQFLELRKLPKLLSLPSCLQHATSLQTLIIEDCKCLKAIPEWFPNSTASLQSLKIYGCPILKERCKTEQGEDWPKIAHIPTIKVENFEL